jgi:transposase-like protein
MRSTLLTGQTPQDAPAIDVMPCPKCGANMYVIRISPDAEKLKTFHYTFECAKCERTELRTVVEE